MTHHRLRARILRSTTLKERFLSLLDWPAERLEVWGRVTSAYGALPELERRLRALRMHDAAEQVRHLHATGRLP